MGGRLGTAFACALAVMACAAVPAAAAPGDGARGAARAYLDAFNRHDGAAICAAWTPEMRRWLRTYLYPFSIGESCAQLARGGIGYYVDAGMGGWTHMEIRSAGAPVRRDGHARVPFVERHLHEHPGGSPDETLRDVIHLVRRDGRWLVAKPGAVFYAASGGYYGGDTILDPPGDPSVARRPSRLAPPRFLCGRPGLTVRSPRGRRRKPWLDVRRVSLSRDRRGMCVAITLAARPRPDSLFELFFQWDRGDTGWERDVELRIDGLDHPHALARDSAGYPGPPRPKPAFGVRGRTVYLLIPRRTLRVARFRWELDVASTTEFDPEVPVVHGWDMLPYVPAEEAWLTYPGGRLDNLGSPL
jgi:hypothetical protein